MIALAGAYRYANGSKDSSLEINVKPRAEILMLEYQASILG